MLAVVWAASFALTACGGKQLDASTVGHGQVIEANGVDVRLDWVRYGGTGTFLRFTLWAPVPGGTVRLVAEGIETEGFSEGSATIMTADASGTTVRLPAVDLDAEGHRVSLVEVGLGGGTTNGRWAFDLRLPDEDTWDEVFQIESLSITTSGDGLLGISAERSVAETLLKYTVEEGLTPAGPPLLIDAVTRDPLQAILTRGTELAGPVSVEGGEQWVVSLPPTPWGETLVVQLQDLDEWMRPPEQRVTIDLAALLGETPEFGDSFEVAVSGGHADGEPAVTGVLIRPEPDPFQAGANLHLDLVNMEGAMKARPANLPAPPEPGNASLMVIDANGRLLDAAGIGGYTGSASVPPAQYLEARVDGHHVMSRVTLIIRPPALLVAVPTSLVILAPQEATQ